MDGEPTGRGQAALVEGDTEFDARDAALMREIHRTGSVAAASTELGRSRARALRRIEALEDVFGRLVERHRGGSSGGGSSLTATGRELLDRYDRLSAALAATATVPETVVAGTVIAVDGEMATVETAVGTLRGLHDGIDAGADAHLRIGADAVTVHEAEGAPEPDSTSARNRLGGAVSGIERGETVLTVVVDVDGTPFRALLTDGSARRLALEPGRKVTLTWKATATRTVQGVSQRSTDQ
ncbi:MAG: TOBE domain-containing protein [Haloferacaceae archaeon]